MRLLITGGAGFIGSAFVRYLVERHPHYSITVLDALTYAGSLENFPEPLRSNSHFRFCYGNIRNATAVEELVAEADVVVHFAAETHVPRSLHDTVTFFETDVLGTQAIVSAIVKHPVERFIHISSSEVYGTARVVPMREDHPLNPTTPYASAKAGADRLVYAYHASYDLPSVIVRPFNTYGPHQHLEKVIPRFITSALLDEPLTIHGDGTASRDWLYVDDLCEALDRLLHVDLGTVKGEVLNLGTGRDTSVVTVAETILRKLGKPRTLVTSMQDRPGQVRKHVADTQKALRILGWKAGTDFERGIERTIRWYAENREWWRKQLWMRSVTIMDPTGKTSIY
ncbi:MAG: dTDP-glucose 4,6-dehydratase [Nitrospinae bacterium]|nr:dTDP-glucose 4,6-dehydratase [Nitrospinota bacterium]